jgi:fructose-1,6-bisphosphatase/sedoheptulose 1,7-bisphosphatase-like protein
MYEPNPKQEKLEEMARDIQAEYQKARYATNDDELFACLGITKGEEDGETRDI